MAPRTEGINKERLKQINPASTRIRASRKTCFIFTSLICCFLLGISLNSKLELIMAIALMMCILPVFLVIPLLLLGYPVLLFENASFTEAFSKSFRIAKDHYGVFLGSSLLGLLISIAGVLLCGIGIVATLPFYFVVMYSAYVAYCGKPRQLNFNN